MQADVSKQSYKQALTDKRSLDTMRHVKTRQKYIDDLGEEAGKKAFFESLQKYRYGTDGAMEWGETIFNHLVRDMKTIIEGEG